jgi:membrane associated rhomboid family serine protease
MGIYDRDYYQDARQAPWSADASMVTRLMLINGAIAILDLFTPVTREPYGAVGRWLTNYMALPSDLANMPWDSWKLFTYGFAHESISRPNGIWHVAWNMYSLWLFGRAVEGVYGAKEFVRVYLTLIAGSGLIWVLCSALAGGEPTVLVGASGAVTGITVLFILHYPHVRFMMMFIPIPIPAWVLGILIIGMDTMGAIGYRQDNVAFAAHLAGAGMAYAYFRSGIRLTPWITWKLPRLARRPRLKVRHPEEDHRDLEREADRVLAKLHEKGADSLTTAERRLLDEYSRQMRQKNQ